MLKKYVASKLFYKQLMIVVLPIVIQFFIQNFINFLDNIMVGQLGEAEIAGVAVSNQYYKIYYPVISAICTGAAIFTAQFFGQNRNEEVQKMFGIKLTFPLFVTIIFFLIGVFFPQKIVGYFVDKDSDAFYYGMKYLKIAIWSYLPLSISTAFAFTFRPIKLTHIPMLAGMIGMLTNSILNLFLIYGLWIFPALGVEGAAIGTVVARIVELGIYLYLFIKNDYIFKSKIKRYFSVDFSLLVKTLIRVVPLFINEMAYTFALVLIFKAYSDLGTSAINVVNISDMVRQVVFILASGLGTATSIFVGAKLGNNEIDEAEKNADYLLGYAVFMGFIIMVVISILAFIVPHFYQIQEETKRLTTYAILIQGLVVPIVMLTRIPFFVLRSGGRVLEVVLLDSLFMWVVKVPVALICGYIFHFSIIPLFLAVESTRVLNAIISMYFLSRKKWLKNITN